MARVNEVSLIGVVTHLPWIVKDDESGEYKRGIVELTVVRAKRNVEDGKNYAVMSNPRVITSNMYIVGQFDTWNLYDLVIIKGHIATKTAKKISICPECKEKNGVEGVLAYINPIFARTLAHFETLDDALAELKHYTEVSNQVTCAGDLTRDPKRVVIKNNEGDTRLSFTQYQIGVNRIFHDRFDTPDKDVDFPWVKSYGKAGEDDHLRLKVGSEIYIDGFLQTRKVLRHATCEHCGTPYDWTDKVLEIVPYRSEYLKNFRTVEEIEELKKRRAEQSYNDTIEHLSRGLGAEDIVYEEDENA